MSHITPTREQDAIIRHREGALLVTASAGTGKTATLTNRCLDLIESGASLDRMLIVTFTISAAEELRKRISNALRKKRRATEDAEQRARLRRQEGLVEVAQIGTIDAWCGRVVRDHFEAVGVDPNWRIMPPEEAIVVRRRTVNALMEWALRANDPLAADVRDWLGALRRPLTSGLAEDVLALSAFRERLAQPDEWLANGRAQASLPEEELRRDEERQLTELAINDLTLTVDGVERVHTDVPDDAGWIASKQTWLREQLDRLQRGDALRDVVADWGKNHERKGLGPAGELAGEAVKQVELRFLPAKIAKTLEFAPLLARRRRTLLDLESRFNQQLSDAKRELAAYEFGDVLRMTLDLLADYRAGVPTPTALARRLAGQYDHVLVDEYQDTSPVQHDLFRVVSDDGSRLAMIGDVKQSIFAFRSADPRQFGSARRSIESGSIAGAVLPLTDNFRSAARLVDAINGMFEPLFDERFGGVRYDATQALRAGRADVSNPTMDTDPRVEVWLLDRPSKGRSRSAREDDAADDDPPDLVETEAAVIADRIHALREAGAQVVARDTGELREMRYSDIVVLTRVARDVAGPLAAALRKYGVPAIASGRESLFDSMEVSDVFCVLSLLVSGRRDLELAAYLRGPLVGLSEPDLLRIREKSAARSFALAAWQYCRDGENDDLRGRVQDAYARLRRWRAMTRTADLPTLVRAIIRDSGMEEFALGRRQDGLYRASVLRAFEALADQCAQSGQSVAEFVEFVDAMRRERPPTATGVGGEDAVRILTIHVAKGLEFPVVFLATAGRDFRDVKTQFPLVDAEHGLGLRVKDGHRAYVAQNAAFYGCRKAVTDSDREEELRLLYVAATRAREKLYIVGGIPPADVEQAEALYKLGEWPSLIARRIAKRTLDWVLMSALRQELSMGAPPLVRVRRVKMEERGSLVEGLQMRLDAAPDRDDFTTTAPALTPDDEKWAIEGVRRLRARIDDTLSRRPAALSVSAVKQSLRASESGKNAGPARVLLRAPVFATRRAGGVDDSLAFGAATHRFLEHMRPTCLFSVESIRAEIAALVERGAIDADEAVRLRPEDIGWLGATEEGRLIAGDPPGLRREAPFVLTDPRLPNDAPLLRGVIDCLAPTPDGHWLIDYKTDQIPNDDVYDERVRSYSIQARLYAIAVERLLNTNVRRAVIVFLSARRRHIIEPPWFAAGESVFDAAPMSQILAAAEWASEAADDRPVDSPG
ncbi:MAG: UvrD-helicase domain-containing protein [Phycisphaerales bacterium]|nr:UvrD-helicase domain-containing protein [Phycisphaerales bacterium]